jgi:hypothetical protein
MNAEAKEPNDPVAEELTLEPREPGKTTEEAFEKSLEASADTEIVKMASSPGKTVLSDQQLLGILKMGPSNPATRKIIRDIKKSIKETRKASRPSWRR